MSATPYTWKPSFYTVGGTLRRDAPSYVVREADCSLYSALRNGEVCYALTPRQMGKSSLMVRTAARLREDGWSVAVLDLTALGQNLLAEQWYNGLIERVGQQLRLGDEIEDYWEGHSHLGPLQRWTGEIRDVVLANCTGRVVIFIDEIDAVRSLPFSTDEFFAGIREFYNRRTQDHELSRLTFCLLGVATPSDLIRDTRTTPFNIGRRIELTDFTEDEAAPLAQGLGREEKQGEQLLKRILYWTGGHPYLTQRLCQAVAEDSAHDTASVDRACNELFLSNRARERDDNLLFVRERILRSEVDTAELLTVYVKVRAGKRVSDEENSPTITILRLSGITKVERGALRVRNRIYYEVFDKNWVIGNLPGAELRRQRGAYLKGLKIASAVAVPLVVLSIGYGLFKEYNTNADVPRSPRSQPPSPPVFWASFTRESLSTSMNFGALLIKTSEESVAVYVNNSQYGRTSKQGLLQIPALQVGNYDIRVEKPGFQSVLQSAKVFAQQESQLTFKLERRSEVFVEARLVIREAPVGAQVVVDGRSLGLIGSDGGFSSKVLPGEHEVSLQMDGYIPKTITRQFGTGATVIDGALAPDQEFREWAGLSNGNDAVGVENFVDRYPNGRYAPQARSKLEQLQWSEVKGSNDLQRLDQFTKKYPGSQYSKTAQEQIAALVAEDTEWHNAQASADPAVMQAFLNKYPRGRYAQEAGMAIRLFQDQQAIVQLVRDFQDAYNRQDLPRIVNLWPSCPGTVQSILRTQFKASQSGTRIVFSVAGEPRVTGNAATAFVSRTRQTDAATMTGKGQFKFVKQNNRWFIETGTF